MYDFIYKFVPGVFHVRGFETNLDKLTQSKW